MYKNYKIIDFRFNLIRITKHLTNLYIYAYSNYSGNYQRQNLADST